ncbi:MAG: hypothetical protein ACO1PM_16695 [Acidovorax sp.]
MNTTDVDKFEKLVGQLTGLYEEMSIFSKKSPNDAVNKFKLKFINSQIIESNLLLGDRYRPFDDFDVFSEDDIPQNSDVVLILSQYLQCMEKLRGDHVFYKNGSWSWRVKATDGSGEIVMIRSTKPKHLRD